MVFPELEFNIETGLIRLGVSVRSDKQLTSELARLDKETFSILILLKDLKLTGTGVVDKDPGKIGLMASLEIFLTIGLNGKGMGLTEVILLMAEEVVVEVAADKVEAVDAVVPLLVLVESVLDFLMSSDFFER